MIAPAPKRRRRPAATFTKTIERYAMADRFRYLFPGDVLVVLEPIAFRGGQVDHWHISRIISQTERGAGHGGRALRSLCEFADMFGVTLSLDVGYISGAVFGDGLACHELTAWYERHAFRARGVIGPQNSYMKRNPQKSQEDSK